MLVYLAGAMTVYHNNNQWNKAIQWREESENFLKCFEIKYFNPCDNFEQSIIYKQRGVVLQNMVYLKNTDVLLVNLDEIHNSTGTIFEIYYAYLNHIPVIAFGKNHLYPNQPHITESITMHFDYLYDALDYIGDMYRQNNGR